MTNSKHWKNHQENREVLLILGGLVLANQDEWDYNLPNSALRRLTKMKDKIKKLQTHIHRNFFIEKRSEI